MNFNTISILYILLFIHFGIQKTAIASTEQSPSSNQCQGNVLTPPAGIISLSKGKVTKDAFGQLAYNFNYTVENAITQRTYVLPSAVDELRRRGVDSVVVFAGNSGGPYQGTRHNFAQVFLDWLIADKLNPKTVINSETALRGHPLSVQPPYIETVLLTFDNGDTENWTKSFITEPHTFRTGNGHFYYLPNFHGKRILLVQHIGDYNEVGDFVIPLIERLGLDSRALILVRDEIDLPPADIQINSQVTRSSSGNNSRFSLFRNIGYRIIRLVQEKLEGHQLFENTERRLLFEEFIKGLREYADIRYQGHLSNLITKLDYSQAYRNENAIKASLKVLTNDFLKKYTRARTEEEIQKAGNAYTDLQKQMAELGKLGDQPGADRKSIGEKMKNIKSQQDQLLSNSRTDISKLESLCVGNFAGIVDHELQFRELVLGTGRPTDGSTLPDFVLSPLPKELKSANIMEDALAKLTETITKHP